MDTLNENIVELGKKAYKDGNPKHLNPFRGDDSEDGEYNWIAWNYGWRKAREDDPNAEPDQTHKYDPNEDIPCDSGPQL